MENHAYEWDLLAKGRKEGLALGKAEGIAQGKTEGEEKYAKLIEALFADGKADLVLKTANDPELRESLYKQYGIQ